MKKKFAIVNRVSALLMTGLIRTFELSPNEIAEVPRYIVEDNAVYELDEESITVEETGNGSAEGADVVTFSRKVEDLSDNDLARLEKEIVSEGIPCELLSVAYKVEEEDKNGMPVRYSAVCEYGGLKKYSTSYPVAWRLTAHYGLLGEPEIVEIQEEAGEDGTRTTRVTGKTENGEEASDAEREDLFPKPEIRRIQIKPSPDDGDKMKKLKDLLVPLAAAAAAGTGVIIPFIIWIAILTAPLFGLKREGKYRYIGRIRLKKEDGTYAAYLTKRLRARAELPVFQIKLPERVWRNSKTGVLQVHCPGGKSILVTIGRKVCFTVEGD